MRKIYVLATAMLQVLAINASPAFASSKFLVGGNQISGFISIQVTAEILLEDMNVIGKPDVLCSGSFDGIIEPAGTRGAIEAVLTLAGELLEVAVPKGDLIECDSLSTCSNPTDLIAIDLPWTTELVLEGSVFVELIRKDTSGEPGYTIDCNSIIGLVEDTCTGATGAIMTNETEGVLGEFSETDGVFTAPGNCTQGGEGEGLLAGTGVLKNLSGTGTLSVSE